MFCIISFTGLVNLIHTAQTSTKKISTWSELPKRLCVVVPHCCLVRVDSGTIALMSEWCFFFFSFLSSSLGGAPRWEEISLFMGDVTPREEVSEEDKHKDKSSGRHLIFNTDEQTAGEGFLWARDSPLFPPIDSCCWDGRLWRKTFAK